MRVHVVSDVHGRADALARAREGADAVICLGDMLQFLDYADSQNGIFADLFGAGQATRLISLRTAQRFDEARAYSRPARAPAGGQAYAPSPPRGGSTRRGPIPASCS